MFYKHIVGSHKALDFISISQKVKKNL